VDVPGVAADDAEFIQQVGALEAETKKRSEALRKTARNDNYAAKTLGALAPLTVAVATGYTTLSDGKSLTAGVLSVAATALTAALAGWAPGVLASRNWASHADFHLIAGRAGDLRTVRAKYLSLNDALRELDALRMQFAAAIRRAHGEQPTARSDEDGNPDVPRPQE
jgi:hypothetical protein